MRKEYVLCVKIEFKSLGDLFFLPCVKGLTKDRAVEGGIVVRLWPSKMADGITPLAYKGQWLCQDRDGMWVVSDFQL